MRPGGKRFLDTLPTARTVLARILWWDGDDWHIVHDAIGLHEREELTPCRIMNTLGKFLVLDQVADLKVFVGNQVVRRDERVRRFPGEIFTLPLDFQIGFGQTLSRLLAVLALFLFTRDAPMETFEFRLACSVVTWVLNGLTVGVRVEDFQTPIDADHTSSLDMLDLALGLDTELAIISICATEETNPFDLLDGEGFDVLPGIADQAEFPNTTAIGEGDMTSIWVELPSGLLILDASIVVLKLGVAFLTGFVVAAILIEARDGKPGTVSRCLASLRIEAVGKRVLFSQNGTIALEVILAQ